MKIKQAPRRSVILAGFCIFAAVLLALLIFVPLQLATVSLGNEVNGRVATTSSVSAKSIDQQLLALTSLTSSFARTPGLMFDSDIPISDPTNPMRERLNEMRLSHTKIRTVFTLDASGHVFAVEPWNNPNLGADYSFRDYFTGAVASDKPYVSETFVSSAKPPRKLVAISNAIRNPMTNEIEGVLVATVDVQAVFQEYVDQFQKEHDITLTVYDQNANVVATPGGAGTEIVKLSDEHVIAATQGISWSGRQKVDGVEYVTSYSPVTYAGWSVSAAVSTQSAYAAVDNLRSSVMVIAAIIAGVMSVGVITLLRVLAARDQVKSNLIASEEVNREIIETATQAFYEIDEDGNITKWNRQAEITFGWQREEVLGKALVDVVVLPERRDIALENIRSLFSDDPSTPTRLSLETSTRRAGKEEVVVDVRMWRTLVNGEKRINALVQDITERKRLEEERELIVKRQRHLVEELRQADKVKSDFISTVSHELRTPLTSIIGYLEMLNDGFGGDLSEQQGSMLEVVDRNSRRLLELIDDVLTLSRIESGEYRGSTELIDIRMLIEGAYQALIPSARDKQLNFTIDVADDTGCVMGDGHQLERVILNILTNSIKFTPHDGRIAIQAYKDESNVRVTISDTGIGIATEEQGKLFGRFFRASSAQEHAIGGTGLGLTIVKSIVERHGGTIAIQSALNIGTTVYLEFPIPRTVAV